MSEPTTEAGRALLERHADAAVVCGMPEELLAINVRAIEAEARADAYASVLRGLRSEDDTLQLRAIIASVEADLAILQAESDTADVNKETEEK